MGRTPLNGNEKCPRIDRKTGRRCNKLGRRNPKPMMSWNTKRGYDVIFTRTRAYMQFIHNDGTRHNINTYEDHRFNQYKGHPNEKLLIFLNTLSNVAYGLSNYMNMVAHASLMWSPQEQKHVLDSFKQGNFEPLIKKYDDWQYERRRKIYQKSLQDKDDQCRSYGSVEYERIDKIARALLNCSGTRSIESELGKIEPEERPRVIGRVIELIDAYMKRLNDHSDYQIGILKEVAEEKGYPFLFKIPRY